MSFGEKIVEAVERRRDRKRKSQPGPTGQFWRNGGKQLLYDLPVTTGSLVIDVGGYEGEWTAGMISRYGCRSQLYEPAPAFANICKEYFLKNDLVQVHKAALGGSDRQGLFSLLDNGTSEFGDTDVTSYVEADVVDVARIFSDLAGARVACVKLNIEGGEYEVLERMLETNNVVLCDSLLIQFHRKPDGYKVRYKKIVAGLQKTHTRSWCYEMVWEKWMIKDSRLCFEP